MIGMDTLQGVVCLLSIIVALGTAVQDGSGHDTIVTHLLRPKPLFLTLREQEDLESQESGRIYVYPVVKRSRSYKKVYVPVYASRNSDVQVYVANNVPKEAIGWKGRGRTVKKRPKWSKPVVKVAIYNAPMYSDGNNTRTGGPRVADMVSITSTTVAPLATDPRTPMTQNISQTIANTQVQGVLSPPDTNSIQTPLNEIRYNWAPVGVAQHKGLLYNFEPLYQGQPNDVSKEGFVPPNFIGDLYSDFPDNFRSFPNSPDISEGQVYYPGRGSPPQTTYKSPSVFLRPVSHSSLVTYDQEEDRRSQHGHDDPRHHYHSTVQHDPEFFQNFESSLFVPLQGEPLQHFPDENRRQDSGETRLIDTKKTQKFKSRRRMHKMEQQNTTELEQEKEVNLPSDATTVSYYHEIQHGNITTRNPQQDVEIKETTTATPKRGSVSRGRIKHRMTIHTTESAIKRSDRPTSRTKNRRDRS